jgi:mycothiol synthase
MSEAPAVDPLSWRPVVAADVPAWRRLVLAAAVVDRDDENPTEDDLADELAAPNLDPARDTLAAVTADGELLALGVTAARPPGGPFRRYDLWGTVHPDHRGRGLGRRLLAWQLDRAAEQHAESGADVEGWPGVGVKEYQESTRRLCLRAGMTPLRHYTGLLRRLDRPVEVLPPPAGIRLLRLDPDRSPQALAAHNDAWRDHWGFSPRPQDLWDTWGPRHRNFRPDWSLLAVDDAGTVVGYVVNFGWEQEWEVKGRTEGYTEMIGVRRPWRGKGLASALLTASQAAFQASGMECAALDVDSENPTGALRLYRSLGYEPHSRTTLLARRLPPAAG